VLKFILSEHAEMFKYHRYANVPQNACLMVSVVILRIAQNSTQGYEYNRTDCRFISRFRVSCCTSLLGFSFFVLRTFMNIS
ncbi:hypothetical protein K435DRAFT_697254, partial [Dendrothele bispora CBS 962.96]